MLPTAVFITLYVGIAMLPTFGVKEKHKLLGTFLNILFNLKYNYKNINL